MFGRVITHGRYDNGQKLHFLRANIANLLTFILPRKMKRIR